MNLVPKDIKPINLKNVVKFTDSYKSKDKILRFVQYYLKVVAVVVFVVFVLLSLALSFYFVVVLYAMPWFSHLCLSFVLVFSCLVHKGVRFLFCDCLVFVGPACQIRTTLCICRSVCLYASLSSTRLFSLTLSLLSVPPSCSSPCISCCRLTLKATRGSVLTF
jgi:hypothetical protein